MTKHRSGKTLRLGGALALTLSLIVPGAAFGASTVSQSSGFITVTGDNGVNTVTIARGTGVTNVRDESGVTPGTGCVANTAQSADCTGNNQSATINLLGGDDVLTIKTGAISSANVSGGAGNDSLTGSAECDRFTADDGADSYVGGSPTEASLFIFGCNDSVDYSARNAGVSVTLDGVANDGGGEGDNVARDISQVVGSSADDTLDASGVDHPVAFTGNTGNDTLIGSGFGDSLGGSAGNDTVTGNGGNDFVGGGLGDDNLSGNGGDDSLSGDDGNDRVDGGDGDDSINEFGFGEAAVGSIPGQPSSTGTDEIIGGAGEDDVSYGRQFDPNNGSPIQQVGVNVSLDEAGNDGESGENDNVRSDVETVNAGEGDDTLTGNDSPNTLNGGGGKDTIDGRKGVDFLAGGPGDDNIASRDQGFDRVNCGSNPSGPADNDSATTDDIDQVFNCEAVAAAAVPGPVAPVVPVVDKTPAKITISGLASTVKRKTFASKGLTFRVTTNEATSLATELRALAKSTGRGIAFSAKVGDLVLVTKSVKLGTGQRKVTLKPSTKFARALRNKKLRLTVTVTAKDAAGNVSTATKNVRLK